MNNNINNQNQVLNLRYANFGERFSAVLRDFLHIWWLSVLGFVLIQMLQIMLNLNDNDNNWFYEFLTTIKIVMPILFIIYGQPFYSMFADSSSKHATKGKLKQNIYVVNKTGNYLTLSESFFRMLLKYLTLFIPFGVIATIITMCCTKKNQAIHDILLGQYVIKK